MLSPPGFPPRWSGRKGDFNDSSFTNLLEANNYFLCAKQPLGQQTPEFDMLKAAPGDFVGLRYQENGHVTLPDIPVNKPPNRGTIGGHRTGRVEMGEVGFSQPDTTMTASATKLTADRSRYRDNNSSGKPRWIPKALVFGAKQSSGFPKSSSVSKSWPGKYGDFPEHGSPREAAYLTSEDVVKSEIYGSCAMIEVDSSSRVDSATGEAYIADQDVNNIGIKKQLENLFLWLVPQAPAARSTSWLIQPTAATFHLLDNITNQQSIHAVLQPSPASLVQMDSVYCPHHKMPKNTTLLQSRPTSFSVGIDNLNCRPPASTGFTFLVEIDPASSVVDRPNFRINNCLHG
ncbi:hypothetical protein CSAL01_11477 [Colletotrichum salicis]|uniref:DUF7492 domain-containing protein n=1 Tax=Colletotrichum salicis TaxID=1209931 RepID=A0A135V667_9PEZI|nr:hypothetical protein CSAL01_11477 [Colletotrichum salicis]